MCAYFWPHQWLMRPEVGSSFVKQEPKVDSGKQQRGCLPKAVCAARVQPAPLLGSAP